VTPPAPYRLWHGRAKLMVVGTTGVGPFLLVNFVLFLGWGNVVSRYCSVNTLPSFAVHRKAWLFASKEEKYC
jgi:hypothetical protein